MQAPKKTRIEGIVSEDASCRVCSQREVGKSYIASHLLILTCVQLKDRCSLSEESEFSATFAERKSYFLDWLSRSNRREMISTWACSQVKRLSISAERWPLYPCTLVAVWMREWDCTTMKPSENLRMSISQWFVQSRWHGWGRGKFHLLKGKSHTKLASAWAVLDFPAPVGSFRSKKPVKDSPHLFLANMSTYCLCINEGLPSCLWNSPSASRGFRRDRLCKRDGGSQTIEELFYDERCWAPSCPVTTCLRRIYSQDHWRDCSLDM